MLIFLVTLSALCPFLAAISVYSTSASSSNWLTYHQDLSRDGFDSTPVSQPPAFSWKSPALDGSIYAEPLVYRGLVYVATENDSVYALNESNGHVAWRANLGAPVPGSILPCGDINPSGITGTPAIDSAGRTLYAVAYLYRGSSKPPVHVLFGLSVINGRVLFRRNVDPPGVSTLVEQERGALAIANGVVYVPYGGLAGDCGLYHGFVAGVPENGSATTFYYRTPTENRGGIWATSGPSISLRSGDVFVATGNSNSTNKFDYGDAVIRLSSDLKEEEYFAPSNWSYLNAHDLDLGSVGPALLGSGGGLIFQIGKEGVGYLLNATHLGGIGGQLFSLQVCPSGSGAFGGTAFAIKMIYIPCTSGLVALRVKFASSPPSFSIAWSGPSFHAGPPVVSGNGVVWTVDIDNAVLYALNASSGAKEFSAPLGSVVHFTSPTSAGGTVFVAADDVVYSFTA